MNRTVSYLMQRVVCGGCGWKGVMGELKGEGGKVYRHRACGSTDIKYEPEEKK